MSASEIDVRVKTDSSGVQPGMDKAAAAVKEGIAKIKGHFDGLAKPFEKLNASFVAIGAVLAGGAIFRESVEATRKFSEEAVKLSLQFGITATEASALNIALGDIQTTAEAYGTSATMLTRQIRMNEAALNKLGLVTRDAKGHLLTMRELMDNALETLRGYKEGTDRNLAAQVLFGRGVGDVNNMLRLTPQVTEEAKQKQAELGLVVGKENKEAFEKYRAAMNDADDVMLGVKKVIGDALMPVLTELANMFAAAGPNAIGIMKVALQGLMTVFHSVAFVVQEVYSAVRNFVSAMIESIGRFGDVFYKILTGDFAGAFASAQEIGKTFVANLADDAVAIAKDRAAKIAALFADPTVVKPVKDDGTEYHDPKAKGGAAAEKKAPVAQSRVSLWESMLAQEKVAYQVSNNLREMSKAEEIKYWKDILATQNATSNERIAIEKRVAMLQLEELKKAAMERKALQAEEINEAEQHAASLVDLQEQQGQEETALGMRTNAEMLDLQRQYEAQRFQIAQTAQQARIAAMEGDPNHSPAALQREKDQLLAIERQYALNVAKIDTAIKVEATANFRNLFTNIEGAFGQMLTGLLTRQQTFAQSMRSLFSQVAQASAQMVSKILIDKAAAWMKESVLYKMLMGEKVATTAAGEAAAAGSTAAGAAVKVSANAVSGATGAAASVASTPFIGPILAASAFASIFALLMGATSSIKSAAGGYSVPRGINPLVQVHSEEMILPAEHSNVIRGLAEGGGGGGGNVINLHFNGVINDDRAIRKFLVDNHGAVVAAVNVARRNFVPGA